MSQYNGEGECPQNALVFVESATGCFAKTTKEALGIARHSYTQAERRQLLCKGRP
jgi:hypothetical protein